VVHPELGDFVRVRDRRWLVEAIRELGDGLQTLTLPGIDDDALAEQTDIVWAAEIDAEVLKQDDWATLLGSAPEDPALSPPIYALSPGTRPARPIRGCSRRRFGLASDSTPTSCCRPERPSSSRA
jgi:hypothetical protein